MVRLILFLQIATLAACSHLPNSGITGPSDATIGTTKDPGIFGSVHSQAVTDSEPARRLAKFTSVHPGAKDGGIGTTGWTYVRGVEFDLEDAIAGELGLSRSVVDFLSSCAPIIDPSSDAGKLRSGILRDTGRARLIQTRLVWDTLVGPGPNKFDTVRISNARLQVFGTTVPLSEIGRFDISIAIGNGSQFDEPTVVLERRNLLVDPSLVQVDCGNETIVTPTLNLGETGWFPRGATNNIQVEVVEK